MRKYVTVCSPCGVCAGVRRALDGVEKQLASGRRGLFLLHELVHNRPVMEELFRRGVRMEENVSAIPAGGVAVLSAHGTCRGIAEELARRGLDILDTTCPWVAANLRAAAGAAAAGAAVVALGDARHAEVAALLSYAGERSACALTCEEIGTLPDFTGAPRVAAIAQTTLDETTVAELSGALRRRYGARLSGPTGVCFATSNRQKALRLAARDADFAVILGSPGSANSAHLAAVARECGLAVLLLDDPEALKERLPEYVERPLLSAGASVPDSLLAHALAVFASLGFARRKGPPAAEEKAVFPSPAIGKNALAAVNYPAEDKTP